MPLGKVIMIRFAASLLLGTALLSTQSRAQSRLSTAIEFQSGGVVVRGRFFEADQAEPLATLVLVPGWPGNPDDVLGLGARLSGMAVNVVFFNPRGLHRSEGTASFAHTLEDIGACLAWLEQEATRRRFKVDSDRLILGGYSYGGGMALAFAASHREVRRVISIGGNDHGHAIRRIQRDSAYGAAIRRSLAATNEPDGPARFNLEADLQDLADHQDVYGLRENAGRLADRSILLIGGWEDSGVTVEDVLLPFYRALKAEGAADVTMHMYHDNHGFGTVREAMATDLVNWMRRHLPE